MPIDPMYILKNQLAPKHMNVLLQSIVHTQKVILMPIKKKSAPEKNSFYFPLKLFPIFMLSPNPISLHKFLGIAILAVGIYVLVDPKFSHFKNIASIDVVNVASSAGINLSYIGYCGIAFCVFGGVMLLISFMGCCGAMKKVRCLLGLYSTVLLILLLAEIGIGIFAGVYSGKLRDLLAPQLKKNIEKEYMGDASNKTIASIGWDTIMFNVS